MPHVCPTCGGSGMQTSSQGGVFAMTEPCRDCLGRGLIVDDPCPVCHGSGRGTSTRTIQARIPAGVKDGQKIRLRGKGAPGERGGPNGDLYVVVHVSSHRLFGRKGDNLTLEVPVRFDEVVLGAEISVPTLNGAPVKLKIPAGTPNGRTFRVAGRGAPRRDGTKGDLLVTVDVETPKQLDDATKAAVESLREAIGGSRPASDAAERRSVRWQRDDPDHVRRQQPRCAGLRDQRRRRAHRHASADPARLRPAGSGESRAVPAAAAGGTRCATSSYCAPSPSSPPTASASRAYAASSSCRTKSPRFAPASPSSRPTWLPPCRRGLPNLPVRYGGRSLPTLYYPDTSD